MGENGGLAEPYSGIYPLRKGFEVKGPDAGQQVILAKREGQSGQPSCGANGEGSISAGQRMGRKTESRRNGKMRNAGFIQKYPYPFPSPGPERSSTLPVFASTKAV